MECRELGKVFLYWDNSNIFISAQEVAAEKDGEAARFRVRVHFRHLLELARAGRDVEHAVAVGSIPPELRHVWNRLERMHKRGWRIEVLSWRHSCNRRMREWAEQNGKFVALDDFYESVTFLERPAPGEPMASVRVATPVDFGRRPDQ